MAIITISRDLGSGGREVGLALAESAGYRFVDKEGILSEIHAGGYKWSGWAEEFDEHMPHVWEKYDWTFAAFIALLQSAILSNAAKDRAVIMGRGGNFLLKGIPFVLSVRVVAAMEDRVSRLIRRESVDGETARWLIEKSDRERAGFLYTVYGNAGKDLTEYDLTFDSASTDMDEIVTAIKAVLPEKDRMITEESVTQLEMRALAARIKAELLTRLPFFVPTIDVLFDGRNIRLKGVIHTPKEHEIVEAEARRLAGPVPVKCDLHYRG
jgi:cytidylate kinase